MLKNKQIILLQLLILLAFMSMTMPYPTLAPMLLGNDAGNTYLGSYQIPNKILVSLVLTTYPLGLFLGGLVFGVLSDRYAKNNLLIFGLFAAAITQLCSGILVSYQLYHWLLFSRLLSGVFEGNIVIARASLASICDTQRLKLKHFGRMNVALTLGWIIGPVMGGLLSHHITLSWLKYSSPYFISASLSLFVIVLVYTQLKLATINAPSSLIYQQSPTARPPA